MSNSVVFEKPVSAGEPILEAKYILKQHIICEWTISDITTHQLEKVYSIHALDGKRKSNLILYNFYECLAIIALDDIHNAYSLDFIKVREE